MTAASFAQMKHSRSSRSKISSSSGSIECRKEEGQEEGHSTETGAALKRRRLLYDVFVLAAAAAAAAAAELEAAAAAAAEAGCSIIILDRTLDIMELGVSSLCSNDVSIYI